MKQRIIGLFIFGMFLSFSGMSCGGDSGGGGKSHNGFYMGPIGIIAIVNMDTDMNGVPNDTYAYMIMIRDDTANNMVADPPVVTMPDGSTLPTYCAMGGNETACSTVIQIPPGGSKTDVPTGDYSIANNGDGVIVAFTVLADDLNLCRVADAQAQLVGNPNEWYRERVEALQLGGHRVDRDLVRRGEQDVLFVPAHSSGTGPVTGEGSIHHGE